MTIYNIEIDNDNVSDSEFPSLTQTSPIQLHSYFQSELVFFYFNLSRGSNAFSDRLANVLQLLKKQLQTNFDEWLPYLKLYYRMIGHTRDYILGKGERELTYMMIWIWYQYFPTLAVYAVHRLVQCGRERESCEFIPGTSILTTTRTDDSYKTPFGSWRDIRSICQYVYDQKPGHTDHPLIDSCVELMNRQLKTDLEVWRYSYRTRSREHISNVAKWIPREHKQFTWLNEKLAIQWTKTHFPCIFNTAIKADSYIYAVNKSKKLYRKTVSMLNKALDTTEIKQCAKKLTDIDPRNVPTYTMMKQRDLIFGDIKLCDSSLTIIERDICADNFKRFFDTKYNCATEHKLMSMYRQDSEPILFAQMPVGYFVKEALRLLDTIGSDTETNYKIDLLNKQWVHMSNTVVRTGFDNILPMIDVSLHMQNDGAESYYTAIGLAILLAERSSFGKRILAVDNLPTWINLEEETLLVSMVSVINLATKSNRSTTAEFKNAFNIISSARISTSNKKNPLFQLKIVVFSNFVDSTIDRIYKMFVRSFANSSDVIAFWNLSKSNVVHLDQTPSIILRMSTEFTRKTSAYTYVSLQTPSTGNIQPESLYDTPLIGNVMLLSGFSSSLINSFVKSLACKNYITPYNTVCNILNSPRYDVLDNYICKLTKH